jgi:hypothetical protein
MPPPATLAMAPASDNGTKGDNVTKVIKPTISGTGEDGDIITLFDGTTEIGTGSVSGGVWSIAAAKALTTGFNAIIATQTDLERFHADWT